MDRIFDIENWDRKENYFFFKDFYVLVFLVLSWMLRRPAGLGNFVFFVWGWMVRVFSVLVGWVSCGLVFVNYELE